MKVIQETRCVYIFKLSLGIWKTKKTKKFNVSASKFTDRLNRKKK
jgi:hypothetical protein